MSEVRKSGHGLLYFVIGALFATSIALAIASYNSETNRPWMDQTMHGASNALGNAVDKVGDTIRNALPKKSVG